MTSNSNFDPRGLTNFSQLTDEQKKEIVKEFSPKKKIWVENSLYYRFYEDQDSDF